MFDLSAKCHTRSNVRTSREETARALVTSGREDLLTEVLPSTPIFRRLLPKDGSGNKGHGKERLRQHVFTKAAASNVMRSGSSAP